MVENNNSFKHYGDLTPPNPDTSRATGDSRCAKNETEHFTDSSEEERAATTSSESCGPFYALDDLAHEDTDGQTSEDLEVVRSLQSCSTSEETLFIRKSFQSILDDRKAEQDQVSETSTVRLVARSLSESSLLETSSDIVNLVKCLIKHDNSSGEPTVECSESEPSMKSSESSADLVPVVIISDKESSKDTQTLIGDNKNNIPVDENSQIEERIIENQDEEEFLKMKGLKERLLQLQEDLPKLRKELAEAKERNMELALENWRLAMLKSQGSTSAQYPCYPAAWSLDPYAMERMRKVANVMECQSMLAEVDALCSAELNNIQGALRTLEPLNRVSAFWPPVSDYSFGQLSSSLTRRDVLMEVTTSLDVLSAETARWEK